MRRWPLSAPQRPGAPLTAAAPRWALAVVLIAAALVAPSRAEDSASGLPTALRDALNRGDYASAVPRLERWASRPGASLSARARLAEVYLITGRYGDAERLCEEWLAESHEDAWALTTKARLAEVRGEPGLAETLCRQALAASPGMLPARIGLAEALIAQGKRKDATDEAGFFLKQLTSLIDAEHHLVVADVSTDVLLDVARGCSLYGLATGKPDALKLVVQDLYPEARRRDPEEMRGYVEPAALLLSKHNVEEARLLYEQALGVNPNFPGAHLGLARCHWQANERDEARSEAELALATNPRHPQAHVLLARIDLADSRLDSARQHIRDALSTNPRLGEAWAVHVLLRLAEEGLPESLPDDLAHLPTLAQAEVYRELGCWLSDHRRYGEAEIQYQRALLLAPQDPATTAGLGLCYFRWGKEEQARTTLGEAFELDSFNVRVYNALEVLDFLSDCEERQGHSLVVRSPEQESLLARYLVKIGDDTFSRLLQQFGATADEAVVVELLPTPDLFSARVTGLPGLDMNGACLGQVVAMLAPSQAERPFNWYDTLVHELTHAACHRAAGGQLPQWLEEGLALWAEGTAWPRSWCLILTHAQQANEFLSLDQLDGAFLGEPGSAQRTLAYAQSALAVEFLVEQLGWETLRTLMASAEGPRQWLQSVADALKTDDEDVEVLYKGFLRVRCGELKARMALAESLIREWMKGEPLTQASSEALARLLREEPGAFGVSVVRAFLGEASEPTVVESAAWALVGLDRTDVESALVLADGLRTAGRFDEAKEVYRIALGADVTDPRVHVGLAALALRAESRAEAAQEADVAWRTLSDSTMSLPGASEGQAWKGLADVLAALGDEERAEQARVSARSLLSGAGMEEDVEGAP